MNQGYGQQGTGGQEPQWGNSSGQEPQWNQVAGGSPAPAFSSAAPAPGTDGVAGTVVSGVEKIVKWLMILTIAVVAYRALMGLITFGTGLFLGASGAVAADPDAALLGSGLLNLLLLAINGLISLALLVVAVMTAIKTTGKGRTGAILVLAAVVLSVILFWINQVIYQMALASATDVDSIVTWSFVNIGLEVGHWLLIAAVMIAGAVMARRWVKQNAGTAQGI